MTDSTDEIREVPAASRCLTCQRPLTMPRSAPHKRFCSTACRNEWHARQRANAANQAILAERQRCIAWLQAALEIEVTIQEASEAISSGRPRPEPRPKLEVNADGTGFISLDPI